MYVCMYVYTTLYNTFLNKARGCRGNRKTQTPKGTERLKPRAPTVPAARQDVVFLPFSALRIVISKIWGKNLIHGRALHSAVLDMTLARSATSSETDHHHTAMHIARYRLFKAGFCCLPISRTNGECYIMFLNVGIKASKNLHNKTKYDR